MGGELREARGVRSAGEWCVHVCKEDAWEGLCLVFSGHHTYSSHVPRLTCLQCRVTCSVWQVMKSDMINDGSARIPIPSSREHVPC